MRQSLPANHYDVNHRLLRKAFTVKGLTPSTDFGCAWNVLSFSPFLFRAAHISVSHRPPGASSVHTTLVTVFRAGQQRGSDGGSLPHLRRRRPHGSTLCEFDCKAGQRPARVHQGGVSALLPYTRMGLGCSRCRPTLAVQSMPRRVPSSRGSNACCVGRIQRRASRRAAESCLLCMSPIDRRRTAACRQCCGRGHTIRLC